MNQDLEESGTINRRSIDITFDMSNDSNGRDPDKYSKTLKNYHRLLWTKPLPNGELFNLRDGSGSKYFIFAAQAEKHYLSSDSIFHSRRNTKSMAHIIEDLDSQLVESFRAINSTIGSFILFPGNRIDGKVTINAGRGFNSKIADRFDLTLECIRRHYFEEASPLDILLNRYETYFELFGNFEGFVDFFLLDDLVDPVRGEVKHFFARTKPFESYPLPKDVNEYLEYRENSMNFARQRNERILKWVNSNVSLIT
jgi:hypothetical protein